MTIRTIALLAAAAGGALSLPALAQVHHGDIILALQDGRIITGRDDGTQVVYPRAVFAAELGDPLPGASLEPGFDSEPGALTPGATVGLTLRTPLQKWNGAGFGASAALIRITKNTATISTPAVPGPCGPGQSLILGAVSPTGILHQHAAFELVLPAPDGVYLLELELWQGQPGAAVSDTVRIVFNHEEAEPIHEDAFEWADERHGVPCPANCDASTTPPVLNVADFGCFLGLYAAGDCRANCDGSVTPPVLNVADFGCFLTRYAAGCP